MTIRKPMLPLALAALLLSATGAVAQETPPPANEGASPPAPGWCRENPEACKAQREAFCQENPARCQQMQEKRAERKAWCEQNPEACAEQRAKRQERRAEMQAKCAADPARCEQMKQKARDRWQQRGPSPGAGAGKPPAGEP